MFFENKLLAVVLGLLLRYGRVGQQGKAVLSPQQEQQRQHQQTADGDHCTRFQPRRGKAKLNVVHSRRQRQGDHRVGQPHILRLGIVGRGDFDGLSVNIRRPAPLVGDGGIEQTVLLDGDRAADTGVAERGQHQRLVTQQFHARVKDLIILLRKFQSEGRALSRSDLKAQRDRLAALEIAEAERRPRRNIQRFQQLVVAVDLDLAGLCLGTVEAEGVHAVVGNLIIHLKFVLLLVAVRRRVAVEVKLTALCVQRAALRSAQIRRAEEGIQRLGQAGCQREQFRLLLQRLCAAVLGNKVRQRTVGHKAKGDIRAVAQQVDLTRAQHKLVIARVEVVSAAVQQVFDTQHHIGKGRSLIVSIAVAAGPRRQPQRAVEAVKVDVRRGIKDRYAVIAVERAVVECLGLRYLRAPKQLRIVLSCVGQKLLHVRIALRIARARGDADLVDAQPEGERHFTQQYCTEQPARQPHP